MCKSEVWFKSSAQRWSCLGWSQKFPVICRLSWPSASSGLSQGARTKQELQPGSSQVQEGGAGQRCALVRLLWLFCSWSWIDMNSKSSMVEKGFLWGSSRWPWWENMKMPLCLWWMEPITPTGSVSGNRRWSRVSYRCVQSCRQPDLHPDCFRLICCSLSCHFTKSADIKFTVFYSFKLIHLIKMTKLALYLVF